MLPRSLGRISDYGQTLERAQRELLSRYIAELDEAGVRLFYLASWRDPFGDPHVYAQEIFRAWGLGDRDLLLVFLRVRGRSWRVVFRPGAGILNLFPEERLDALRRRAEADAARGHVARAVLETVEGLLETVRGGSEARGRSPPWVLIWGALGFLYLLLRWLRAIRVRRHWL